VNPSPDSERDLFTAGDRARARRRRAAESALADLGARPAPALAPGEIATVRALDALLAQSVRAGRHSSGAIRAYASLIDDAYGPGSNASHWAGKIERSAGELDAFTVRLATLRVCDDERPTSMEWGEVMARVASRCASIGVCTIEVTDRSRGAVRQRAELVGRILFHLVRNAVEATPRGGLVRIRVDEIRLDGARGCRVRVSDAGSGVSAQRVDEVWRPFITDKRGHPGLGLAYVATCAPLIGAIAGVRSAGDGTTAHLIVAEEGGLQW
jgi:signal transduction histidine kinase